MKIKEVKWQRRFDFGAILECEHCGHERELNSGYDDHNYHVNVLPKFKCTECGKNRAGEE